MEDPQLLFLEIIPTLEARRFVYYHDVFIRLIILLSG